MIIFIQLVVGFPEYLHQTDIKIFLYYCNSNNINLRS